MKVMFYKCNIPQQPSSDIVDAIFGKKLRPTYMEGLIDAADSVDFQEKVDVVLSEWRAMSLPSLVDIERFITWFVTHKIPYYIQDSMLRSVRRMWSWFPSDYIYN